MSERRPHTEAELVDFVRSIDVRAPESLHRHVEALVSARSHRPHRTVFGRSLPSPPRLLGAGAIAAAAIVLAIVLGVAGDSSGPSLSQASALTLSRATAPAPPESAINRSRLAAAVDGVSFPYWEEHFGWRSTGARTDHIAGRTVATVFYVDSSGHRIGYAIVAGAAPRTSGGVLTNHDGGPYRLFAAHGAPAVSWLREGHLCVVSGRGVDTATLLRLASWDGAGPVAS